MLPLIWGREKNNLFWERRNFHVMVDVHVNRFWGWQLSLWPSGRCCLQMFWSGEEKWMGGRKGGEGQSHWTVSSATKLEELRICPATLQKKQKTWQLLIFVLLNSSSKGWKLPTTGFATKALRKLSANPVLLDMGYSEHFAPHHWEYWSECCHHVTGMTSNAQTSPSTCSTAHSET